MLAMRTSKRSAKKLDRNSRKKFSHVWSAIAPAILVVFVYVSTFGLAGCALTAAPGTSTPGSLRLTTPSLPNAHTGQVYFETLAIAGGMAPFSWSVSAGTLPSGVVLGTSNGALSGTPSKTGSYNVTISVSDSSSPMQSSSKAYSMAVMSAVPPVSITTTSVADGKVGTAYSATLAASGGTTPYSWSISSGSLPNGLSLRQASGTISGTPTTPGQFSFTATVTDSTSPTQQTDMHAFSMTITGAAAQPPSVTTASLSGGTVSSAYSTTLAASGGTTPYTWSITTGVLPAGLNLTASSGSITGTPTAAGNSSFTVQVKDSKNNTGTKVLGISIAAAAQPPSVTTASLPGATVSSAYSTTLAAIGGTTPYSWSIMAGALPAGLTLAASSGTISGMPTAAGNSSFTVQVKDSKNNTGTKALSISVTGSAQPTISTSSLPGGTVNITYSTTVSASGGATPYTWGISSGSLPVGLSIGASSGVISGTPTATGSSSFTVQVTDANNATASKALNISVAPGGAAPQLDAYFGLMNVPCTNNNTAFSVTKVGNNEVFCTPAGHAMFARGFYVMDLNLEADPDETGESYHQFVTTKYVTPTVWFTQQLNRIQAWGMNAVGPFANSNLYATEGQAVKMPFVLLGFTSEYALNNRAGWGAGPAKDLFYYVGTSGATTTWSGYFNSEGISDYRDPNWSSMITGIITNDNGWQSAGNASAADKGYVLGFSLDESDGLHGFGAGPDFATQPAGNNDLRLGYLAFFVPPVSYANSHYGQIYTNGTLFMKARWHDMLASEYGDVAGLNSAWGSSYTTLDSSGTCVGTQPVTCASNMGAETFGTGTGSTLSFNHTLAQTEVSKFSVGIFVGGTLVGGDTGAGSFYGPNLTGTINYSTGAASITFASGHAPASGVAITANYIQDGWGIGTGFMDEDCRSSHSAYCGTGSHAVTVNLTGIPANVQGDINALTKDLAGYYATTMDNTVQAWAASHGFVGRIPNIGPTTLGTWSAPPDRYVLQGFAGHLDAWSYGGQGTFTQAELDFVNANMGDVALIEGEYRTANAQSPYSWPNSPATHNGSTVTITTSKNNFTTSWLLDVTCTDPTYNITASRATSVSSTSVVYNAPSTPSSGSTTCTVGFSDHNVGGFPTQAARGQDFFNNVSALPARSFTATGTRPYLGYFWWQYTDNQAEMLDWGPITNRDNAYDGNEDVDPVVTCSSPIQAFSCGGELRGPYGSLIQMIQLTNSTIDNTLLGLP